MDISLVLGLILLVIAVISLIFSFITYRRESENGLSKDIITSPLFRLSLVLFAASFIVRLIGRLVGF